MPNSFGDIHGHIRLHKVMMRSTWHIFVDQLNSIVVIQLLADTPVPMLAQSPAVRPLGAEGWTLCRDLSLLPLLIVLAMKMDGFDWMDES